MSYYSKLIAAVIGILVLIASRYGLELEGMQQLLVDAVVGVVTAVSVYMAKNKPATEDQVKEVRQVATEAKKEI